MKPLREHQAMLRQAETARPAPARPAPRARLEPLTVVCFKWRPRQAYRSTFGARQVNVLRNMVERHYARPHEFVCVTDDPAGIDPRVRIVPLWADHSRLPSPHGFGNPSCYRRLKIYSREAAELFGPRLVSMDLDAVVCRDLVPLWDRPDDFVIWGDTNRTTPYNGSMQLIRAGARAQVWEQFDPLRSPRQGKALGYFGSDQAWIAACLGPNEARWTKTDGVYSYRNEILRHGGGLPADARVVFFHGQHDPWNADVQARHPWVREHYQ